MLDHALRMLAAAGVREVHIVVGYRSELIVQAAAQAPICCHWIVNEDYATTNTIHSLWLARSAFVDDVILLNGDVWFASDVLHRLAEMDGSALAVEVKECSDEEVKVIVAHDERIVRIGKTLPPDDCLGEYVGIGKISCGDGPALIETLRHYNKTLHETDLFYESAVDDILNRCSFTALRIPPRSAIEIDTPQDYGRAQTIWDVTS